VLEQVPDDVDSSGLGGEEERVCPCRPVIVLSRAMRPSGSAAPCAGGQDGLGDPSARRGTLYRCLAGQATNLLGRRQLQLQQTAHTPNELPDIAFLSSDVLNSLCRRVRPCAFVSPRHAELVLSQPLLEFAHGNHEEPVSSKAVNQGADRAEVAFLAGFPARLARESREDPMHREPSPATLSNPR
jgi:hypothetical protein